MQKGPSINGTASVSSIRLFIFVPDFDDTLIIIIKTSFPDDYGCRNNYSQKFPSYENYFFLIALNEHNFFFY